MSFAYCFVLLLGAVMVYLFVIVLFDFCRCFIGLVPIYMCLEFVEIMSFSL